MSFRRTGERYLSIDRELEPLPQGSNDGSELPTRPYLPLPLVRFHLANSDTPVVCMECWDLHVWHLDGRRLLLHVRKHHRLEGQCA